MGEAGNFKIEVAETYYIPYRSISSFALLLVCVLRLFFWTVSAVAFGAIISDLLILLGLFCFTISLNPCED